MGDLFRTSCVRTMATLHRLFGQSPYTQQLEFPVVCSMYADLHTFLIQQKINDNVSKLSPNPPIVWLIFLYAFLVSLHHLSGRSTSSASRSASLDHLHHWVHLKRCVSSPISPPPEPYFLPLSFLPTRPSTHTPFHQACLSRCLNLYMAAFDQVSKSYVNRITRERATMGAAGPAAGGLDATLL